MFEFVRNNKVFIRVVLGVIALTFVGVGVSGYRGTFDGPWIAKVGSSKLYERDLDRVLGERASDPSIRQAALENLVRQELLLLDAFDNGVTVTQEQLRKVIAAIPVFQSSGKFNPERYREFLKNRYASPELFEAEVKRDMLLQAQLTGIADAEFVSGTVLTRLATLLGEKREVHSLVIKAKDFSSKVKLDATLVDSFYSANLKRFRIPERVRLDYVLLAQEDLIKTIQPSEDDLKKYYEQHKADFNNEQRRASHILLKVSKDAQPDQDRSIKAEAEALLRDVRANPGSFHRLAKARSQDPGSAPHGGDLGFFRRGMMVKPFEDVVFRLKPGQISQVIKTDFGYHIIKLDAVKEQNFVELKAEIAEKIKNQQARNLFRIKAEKLADLSYQQGDSLNALQAQLNLQPRRSGWLSRGKSIQHPLLNHPKVVAAAFSDDLLKKRYNSEPLDVGDRRLLVVRVAEHEPERQQTLGEVRHLIKEDLVLKEAEKLAEKKGQALLAQLKVEKARVKDLEQCRVVLRHDSTEDFPAADLRAIFAVHASQLPAVFGAKRRNGDYAIYRIDTVSQAPTVSDADRTQLSAILCEMNANAILSTYLDTLHQKYRVTWRR